MLKCQWLRRNQANFVWKPCKSIIEASFVSREKWFNKVFPPISNFCFWKSLYWRFEFLGYRLNKNNFKSFIGKNGGNVLPRARDSIIALYLQREFEKKREYPDHTITRSSHEVRSISSQLVSSVCGTKNPNKCHGTWFLLFEFEEFLLVVE